MSWSKKKRKRLAKKVKTLDQLFKDQSGICALCQQPMTREEASIDHLIPQKFGGIHSPLQAAHMICNSFRGHDLQPKPPEYFLENRLRIERRRNIGNN